MNRLVAYFWLITATILLVGCASENDPPPVDPTATTTAGGHAHAAGDQLVWPLKETIADTGYEIWFGHHGDHFHGGEQIEPAIAITNDGQPVDNAQVFNGLVNVDNADSVSGEVAAKYEPATATEIAHYAQGHLAIPQGVKKITIRYRVSVPDVSDEITRDVEVSVGH